VACILLTGYPHPDLEEQARNQGARVMLKPAEVPELLEAIRNLLRAR
jgi:DNA-binding response OmpR family regulator